MAEVEWYRRTTWSEADRAAFFARLKRSRSDFHKAQYLRIQAGHLAATGTALLQEAALALLDELLQSYPDSSQLASAWHLRGRCLQDLGRHDEAVASYRQALGAMTQHPNWRVPAAFDFAELVVTTRRRALYQEVLAALDDFGDTIEIEVFPAYRYSDAVSRAFIADETGDRAAAATYARRALEAAAATETPLRCHGKLGLVSAVDPDVIARLQALAA